MSWDIYGNVLRPGHCEVHPHVHEEYPCSICMNESRLQQMQEDVQRAYTYDQNVAMEHQLLQHNLTKALETIVTLEGELSTEKRLTMDLKQQIRNLTHCSCGRQYGKPYCSVCDNDE